MDDSGGLRRFGAARDRPGARLLWAGRQEGDQIEQRVAGADHTVEPGFAEAERSQVFASLLGVGEDGELGFDRRRNHHGIRPLRRGVVGDPAAQLVARSGGSLIDIGDVEDRFGAQ